MEMEYYNENVAQGQKWVKLLESSYIADGDELMVH